MLKGDFPELYITEYILIYEYNAYVGTPCNAYDRYPCNAYGRCPCNLVTGWICWSGKNGAGVALYSCSNRVCLALDLYWRSLESGNSWYKSRQ